MFWEAASRDACAEQGKPDLMALPSPIPEETPSDGGATAAGTPHSGSGSRMPEPRAYTPRAYAAAHAPAVRACPRVHPQLQPLHPG